MKKLLFVLIGILLIPTMMYSVPADPTQLRKSQLSDGSIVEYYIHGDERVNWMESVDGYTLLLNDKRDIVYATLNESGDMVPSNIPYRNSMKTRFSVLPPTGIYKGLKYSRIQIEAKEKFWEIREEYSSKLSNATFSTNGVMNIIVFLVEFPDLKFTHSKEKFQDMLNRENYTYAQGNSSDGSVVDYYKEVSYGKVKLHFEVYGIYQTTEPSTYYQEARLNKLGNWIIKNKLPEEQNLDLSKFVDPGINRIKFTHIIFPGKGTQSDAKGFAHPHRTAFNDAEFDEIQDPFKIENKGTVYQFYHYACSEEIAGDSDTKEITTIGSMCHELGHMLFNIPDYYDANQSGGIGDCDKAARINYDGTSYWDVMGAGNYNRSNIGQNRYGSSSPAHINIYEKINLGWINPQVLTESGEYSLENSAEQPQAYIYSKHALPARIEGKPYPIKEIDFEFFILENKQKEGFDRGLRGSSGLLIYRAHKDMRIVNTNQLNPNCGFYQRIYVNDRHQQKFYPVYANAMYDGLPAIPDSTVSSYGGRNLAYYATFGNSFMSSNKFTDTSIPSAMTWKGEPTGKPITNIVNHPNGLVTFKFGMATQVYGGEDKGVLRSILRQSSTENGKLNLELAGLAISDTIDWADSEEWIAKIKNIYLEWNDEKPKRIKTLRFDDSNCHSMSGKLELSPLRSLEVLNQYYSSFTSLNASNCKNLLSIGGFFYTVNKFDIEGCDKLKHLGWQSLLIEELILPELPALESIVLSGITSKLKLHSAPNLKYIRISAPLSEINLPSCPKVIDISLFQVRAELLDFSVFPELAFLSIGAYKEIQFGKVDFSKNPKLMRLSISRGQFASLELADKPMLERVSCGYGTLESISITNCPKLQYLELDNNKLKTAPDLTNSKASLKSIGYQNNQLESLSIKDFPNLTHLTFQNNKVATFEFENNPNLTHLTFQNNKVANFEFANTPNLQVLNCSNNSIKQLNLSGLSKLDILNCENNQLENLNISGCSRITRLRCQSNKLKTLDLSSCTSLLYEFSAADNQLEEVNTGSLHCSDMYIFHLLGNSLRFSKLPKMLSVNNPVRLYYHSYHDQFIQGGTIHPTSTIDLSSEYNVDGNTTTYNWYNASRQPIAITNLGNGRFIAGSAYDGEDLVCEMTNPLFPQLTLRYYVTISSSATRTATTTPMASAPTTTIRPTLVNSGDPITITTPSPADVEVYNLSGQRMASHKNVSSAIAAPATAGTYILRITANGKSDSHRVIVK